jgi:hypothetical protein
MVTMQSVPPISAELVDAVTSAIRSGRSQQEVFRLMREQGLTITDCMKLAVLLYGMSREEAKHALHFSEAWADMRDGHECFHESAAEAAAQVKLAREEQASLR